MLLQQAFEVDCVDQRSFAVCNSVDLYGSFDEGKSRTRAHRLDALIGAFVYFAFGLLVISTIGKQCELLLVKIQAL